MAAISTRTLSALSLIVLLTGCGTSAPLQPDRYYTLAPILDVTPARAPMSGVLQVNTLAAHGFLAGRQIVYRQHEQPLRVERYDLLLWEETVPRALAQILANAIRDARIFDFVIAPADGARADSILSGEVETFEHRPTDQPPSVVASLNLSLVKASDRRVLWMRRYAGEEALNGQPQTGDAIAEAFNRLTARLVGEVVRDLRGMD